VICEDGDEVRADRNDTIVNRAECASVEQDGSGSGSGGGNCGPGGGGSGSSGRG